MSDSTCEVEYIPAIKAENEAMWLMNFIDDLGVILHIKDPIEIFCDNEGAFALTKKPKDHGISIRILRKYQYVRKRINDGDIIVNKVSSEENLVDPLTKPLSRIKLDSHTKSIGIRFADDMV